MNIIQSSVITLAISFCLLFALLARHLFGRLSLSFFVVYLMLEACGFAFEWLLVHPESPYKALWLGLLMAFSFLMAPCLWLFALETSTNARPSLRNLSRTEWSVIVLGMVLTVPLMLAAHGGSLMVDPNHPTDGLTDPIIHETMLASIALFLAQVPWYLRKCLRIIKTHTRHNMVLFSNIDDMPLNTLRVLIWVMAGNWLVSLLRTLHALTMEGSPGLFLAFTCLEAGITLWALYAILKRSLLFNPDDQNLINEIYLQGTLDSTLLSTLQDAGEVPAEERDSPLKEERDFLSKYAKSSLDNTIRQRIERKLQQAMEVDGLYQQSNLKLRDLCDHLNENTHYVSQVINQSLGTSFYELVNRYRIRAACEMLGNGTLGNSPKKTILDIALEVGFNSKTTFNAAFKRATGITPSQYKPQSSSVKVLPDQ